MWRSRWRCVIKPAYSVSFLLSINIFVWQNVHYFLDAPRNLVYWVNMLDSHPVFCGKNFGEWIGLVTASFQILLSSSYAVLSSYLVLDTLNGDTEWLNTVRKYNVCYRNSFCRQPNSRVRQLSIISSWKTYSIVSYLRDNFFFTLHPSAMYQSQQSAIHFTSFKDSVPISVHITQEPTATTNPFHFPITKTSCYPVPTLKSSTNQC